MWPRYPGVVKTPGQGRPGPPAAARSTAPYDIEGYYYTRAAALAPELSRERPGVKGRRRETGGPGPPPGGARVDPSHK